MKEPLPFLEAAWSLVQRGLRGPESEFDFLKYSQQTFAPL